MTVVLKFFYPLESLGSLQKKYRFFFATFRECNLTDTGFDLSIAFFPDDFNVQQSLETAV